MSRVIVAQGIISQLLSAHKATADAQAVARTHQLKRCSASLADACAAIELEILSIVADITAPSRATSEDIA
jgi:hypothetical protein